MLDTVVMSGDDVCCSVVFGILVGAFVFSVMWSELLMTSAIRFTAARHYDCRFYDIYTIGNMQSVLITINTISQ